MSKYFIPSDSDKIYKLNQYLKIIPGFRAVAVSAEIPLLDHPATTSQLPSQTLCEFSIQKCLHLQF